MDKLLLDIPGEGYAVSRPDNEVISNKLDGGFSETGLDVEGGALLVTVAWVLEETEWQYFEAFFRNKIGYGSEPFLVDLVIDGSPSTEYTAKFDASVKRQVTTNGPIRMVQAQLEALPAEVDDLADSSIIDVFEASGGQPDLYLNLLDTLVNMNWPEAGT